VSGYDIILLVYPASGTGYAPETLTSRVRQLEFLFIKAGLLT
jgi:hypothetical protein